MTVLLDTQAFLWAITADDRLSERARNVYEQGRVLLSVASIWEIVIKVQIGKLALPDKPSKYLPRQIAANAISLLPIDARHAFRLESLPTHHRDPFDRILIAQGLQENLPIVTSDPLFERYGVAVLW